MAVSPKTQKEIWAKFAGRCAICHKRLWMEDDNNSHPTSLIGQIAHIIAQEDNGPRANPAISPEDRDSFDNLILLCMDHHKQIDDNPNFYTVDRLKTIRKERLDYLAKILEAEIFSQTIDESKYLQECLSLILPKLHINKWGQLFDEICTMNPPHIDEIYIEDLQKIIILLQSFQPTPTYPDLSKAIINLQIVINDFLFYSLKYYEIRIIGERTFYILPKFYHLEKYDGKQYIEGNEKPPQMSESAFLLDKFNFFELLIRTLFYELAFAINHVLLKARETFGSCPIPEVSNYYSQNQLVLVQNNDNFIQAIYPPGQQYRGIDNVKKEVRDQIDKNLF